MGVRATLARQIFEEMTAAPSRGDRGLQRLTAQVAHGVSQLCANAHYHNPPAFPLDAAVMAALENEYVYISRTASPYVDNVQ